MKTCVICPAIVYLSLTLLLTSCGLFHARKDFEMEELAEDVLKQKSPRGIEIQVLPIEAPK